MKAALAIIALIALQSVGAQTKPSIRTANSDSTTCPCRRNFKQRVS